MEINSKQLMIVAAIGAAAFFLLRKTSAPQASSTKPLDITSILGASSGQSDNIKPPPLVSSIQPAALVPAPTPAPAPAPAPAAPVFSSGPSGPNDKPYTGGTMTYDQVLLAASGVKSLAVKTEPLSGAATHITNAIGV